MELWVGSDVHDYWIFYFEGDLGQKLSIALQKIYIKGESGRVATNFARTKDKLIRQFFYANFRTHSHFLECLKNSISIGENRRNTK
jgi:hypothetical protein